MKEILEKYIIEKVGSRPPNLDLVLSNFSLLNVKRNEIILSQDSICKNVYFVAKGSLQVFVYSNNLEESTRDIVIENNWCSDLISFGNQTPSLENIRAIENCSLLSIDRNSFNALMENIPQFANMYKQILETSYNNSISRINSLVSLNALEKIKWLQEYKPTYMTRFSSKLISSYLGISQETFSRLKTKM